MPDLTPAQADSQIDVAALSERITKNLQTHVDTVISQIEKRHAEEFCKMEDFQTLRDGCAELKKHTEELAGMVEALTTKTNTAIDELRAIGGKNLPRRTDPEPVQKLRKNLTLLSLGRRS